jgi:hypothetical protein
LEEKTQFIRKLKPELKPALIDGELEPMLTVCRIATAWQTSTDTVRRQFESEDGVLRIGNPSRRVGRKLKRAYFTLRIPLSVYLRVCDRLQQREKKLPRRRAG